MIQIKNLRKVWKTRGVALTAIDNFNLSINKGEFISIIGPSGCGKTTLLKLITGLLKPTNGSISVHNKLRNSVKKLSIVFQNPVLLPWRTVEDNVMLPNELNNKPINDNVVEKIKLVGLDGFKDSFPNELSGGMAQRVAIARALVVNPELLLMDEPFGPLDELNRNKLNLELLKIWRELKPTIIFVTHSITEAVFLSDKVIVLSDRPANVKEIVEIRIPRPRRLELKESLEFQKYVKCIRERLE